uniref:Uncharacterized protein n=1 Tax=Setaria viridis TaxID=4556 RepID=A0A4U6TQ78_SETVI|nr:hypothetical protein SEVIR_7G046133v2 [Setaria viridis]
MVRKTCARVEIMGSNPMDRIRVRTYDRTFLKRGVAS